VAPSSLTIVVPFRGELATTMAFLDSLGAHEPLVLVDDHTPDASVASALRALGHPVIRPPVRPYFNGALRYAIENCATPYLGVLNNDLILPAGFVESALAAFDGWDILVPNTHPEPGFTGVDHLCRQEGWCMLMRAAAVRRLPPVPRTLRIWYGDTWIFHHAWEAGLRVGKIGSLTIRHELSHTIRAQAAEIKPVVDEDIRAAQPYRLRATREYPREP
jgi:hypothetical protein